MKAVAVCLVGFLLTHSALAGESSKDFTAEQIQVLDNSAEMKEHDSGFFTTRSGPVGKEGIPTVISKGDKITVKGKTVTANVIIVTLIMEDMTYQGRVFAKKGDVRCVVASTPEDIPSDKERDRLWIFVEKCKPLR